MNLRSSRNFWGQSRILRSGHNGRCRAILCQSHCFVFYLRYRTFLIVRFGKFWRTFFARQVQGSNLNGGTFVSLLIVTVDRHMIKLEACISCRTFPSLSLATGKKVQYLFVSLFLIIDHQTGRTFYIIFLALVSIRWDTLNTNSVVAKGTVFFHDNASPGRIAWDGGRCVEHAMLSCGRGLMHRIVFNSLICIVFGWQLSWPRSGSLFDWAISSCLILLDYWLAISGQCIFSHYCILSDRRVAV